VIRSRLHLGTAARSLAAAPRVHVAALVAVAAGAAALLLLATAEWGLGVTYDSVAYVQARDDLRVDVPQPRDEGGEPLYWWPPAYPLALNAVGGGYSGARYLSALLLFAGTLLIGGIAWRALGPTGGLAAAALYAFSPAAFDAHLELLAEPLYLVFAAAALALMVERRPALAGLATGAAILTRYAGLPLIVVGALVLRGRDRLKFLAVSVALYLAWLARNALVADQTTGRELRWHPPGSEQWGEALRALVHVVLTPGRLGSVSVPFEDPGVVLQIVAAAALLVGLARVRGRRPPTIVTAGLLFVGLYCAFLLVTVSLFDAGTPLNERLLVPIVPPLALAIAWLVQRTPIAAVALSCVFAVAVLQQVRTVSLYGLHYSGRIWSVASFDGVTLPEGDLHSNWPAAVAYFTGRSPHRLPQVQDPHTLDVNRQFDDEVAGLIRAVRAGTTSLVLLDERQLGERTPAVARTVAALRDECRRATAVVTICTATSR
jgi:hypothetical protein